MLFHGVGQHGRLLRDMRQITVRDRTAVRPDPPAEPDGIRRSQQQTGGITGAAENGFQRRAGRPSAASARHMNKPKPVLRIAHPVQQLADPGKAGAPGLPAVCSDISDRFFCVHHSGFLPVPAGMSGPLQKKKPDRRNRSGFRMLCNRIIAQRAAVEQP